MAEELLQDSDLLSLLCQRVSLQELLCLTSGREASTEELLSQTFQTKQILRSL